MWHCECSCGSAKEVRSDHLIGNKIVSCGCWQKESATIRAESGEGGAVRRTHGLSKHRVYPVYMAMVSRCTNPTSDKYSDYGGRGITVCDRWLGESGFENFIEDMGLPPNLMTIERKKNDLGYGPDNCEWASRKQQARNKRNSRKVVFRGVEMLLLDVATECGVPYKELHRRLSRGWDLDRATTKPFKNCSKRTRP